MSFRNYWRASGAALAGLAMLGLTACGEDEPERDESGAVTEGGEADVFSLQVGDCISGETEGQVSSTPVVPCDEPHESEAFYSHIMDEGGFPGAAAFQTAVEEHCVPAFAEYVGVPLEESALDITWLEPSQQSWDEGADREVLCMVYDPAGQTTGTLEGAAR